MKKNYISRLFTFFLLFPILGWGQQAGSLDRSFNYGRGADYQFNYGNGPNSRVYTTAVQGDGKIIIGGIFTSFNGTTRNRIARLNVDGSLDSTFNPGTGASSEVQTIALQSDGKIIIGGDFTSFNGTARNRIARLNIDGSLDATFNPSTGANARVQTTTLQADGKIIIVGAFTDVNGTTRNRIARLNTDGSLDTTFNPSSGANNTVWTIALQPDNKIIIGGSFTTFNSTARNYIARLNADGSLDANFNLTVNPNNTVQTITLQADGKIIIGGEFTSVNNTNKNYIARLNASGSLDATFNTGIGADNKVLTTALQADGKIIIGGEFTSINGSTRNFIARLNADGSLNANFNPGTAASYFVQTTSLQADGKIIIGGSFYSYNGTNRNCIARLNADGSLHATFNPLTGVSDIIYTSAVQADSKIIIGGGFFTYNGNTRNSIARLNANGSLDATFNSGTGVASGNVQHTALQADGKIRIGGNFTSYDGTSIRFLARLNVDGSLDPTFNPGTGANATVRTTALQADNKIIIGGYFTSYNGTTRNRIARLNADGSLDPTFNPSAGANGGEVSTIALQADGKIIIAGAFSTFNGTTRKGIARLNADGSLDPTFNPGTGANLQIQTTALQADGKIIIGGRFSFYNGTARKGIARLNADGSLDPTFNPLTGVNGWLETIALQADGKIIIGGNFSYFNGTTNRNIARLNADGSLDVAFNPGTGTNSTVLTTAMQADGKIIIGGPFTGFNNLSTPYIARINSGGCITPATPTITTSGTSTICIGSSLVLTSNSATSNLWSNGATSQSITITDTGTYTVRVVSGSCTSASSNTFTVSVENCGYIFTGTGNYSIASNWANNQVPAAGSTITVFGNMTVNSNISYGNIAVRSGGTINITNGNILSTTGNLTNQGVISGEGTLRLSGSNNQNFGGGTIANLLVNNSATIIQSAATQISGSLTLGSNQVLNLNNNRLTLLSTATHTAQLAQVPVGSSITSASNFTVQRWLNKDIVRRGNASEGNYYFLGPVVQGQTMNLWNAQSPYNNQTFNGSGVGNLYLYNATANNWFKPSSASTPLPVGAGVQVWFGASTFFGSRSIWSVTGTPQVGDYNLPITSNQGFHLLSNPYPSTIDWDSPNWTKTNVSNAIYVYDWVNRRYKSYINGLGSNGGCRYLPTAQGFFVFAETNNPVLTARESNKVSNQVALQRTESQISSIIRLQTRRGSMTDEVVIAHRPNTQLAFEPQVDARKMINPATNIFVGGAVRQSIASMDFNATTVIPIELLSDSTGIVTLSTTEFSGLSGGTYYLVDEMTTEVFPYTPQTNYQFYLNANEPYSLRLRMNNVNGVSSFKSTQFEVYPNPASDKVTIRTNGSGTLEIVNVVGQVVMTQSANETNEINVYKLAKGVYSVRFNGASKMLVVQ